MFYLVHCNTHECVDFQAIIGIANCKRGVMELLFNYHKYHFILLPSITFEMVLREKHIITNNIKVIFAS